MKDKTSRRAILQGLIVGTVVIGFDVVNHSWVTSALATDSFVHVPHLDGVLYTDDATRAVAADDFGHIVHRQPLAVLKPGSIEEPCMHPSYHAMGRFTPHLTFPLLLPLSSA